MTAAYHERMPPMRRYAALALSVLVASATDARPQSLPEALQRLPSEQRHEGEGLTVFRGQAEVRRYSVEPGTIIVGDPEIAIAAIVASDVLVLTGLQPGETNVIVLDEDGEQMDRIALRVVERGHNVLVGRGRDSQILRCGPTCSPLTNAGVAVSSVREPAGRVLPSIPASSADGSTAPNL